MGRGRRSKAKLFSGTRAYSSSGLACRTRFTALRSRDGLRAVVLGRDDRALPRGQLPQKDGAVQGGRGEHRALGVKGQALDGMGMAREDAALGFRRHVPQPHRRVVGAGGEAGAVRAERHAQDELAVAFENAALGPRRHVPQPDRGVVGAGGQQGAPGVEGNCGRCGKTCEPLEP